MADDDRNDAPKGHGLPVGPKSQPPFLKFMFWVVVIASVPLLAMFLNKNQDTPKRDFTAGDLYQAMEEQRVEKLIIYTEPANDTVNAVGDVRETVDSKKTAKFDISADKEEIKKRLVGSNLNENFDEKVKDNTVKGLVTLLLPVVIILVVIYFFFSRQMKNAGRGAMQFGKSRAKLAQNMERVTFKDVAGIDNAREEVVEIVEYLRDPGRFHKLGGRIPRGVLLVGPPGTGKTLLARAIAGEAAVPFFSISGSDFVEMFVGVGASRVRDMFEQAKRSSPCIIFIDEIDAVGRSRFSGMGGGHDEREQTLNALLVEMDGFEANSGVIVVAATNRPDVLDKALLRPGRFDRQVNVELPDLVGRKEIIQVHIKKITASEDINLEQLARSTPGFSGADLANLLNEAALNAARKGKEAVELDDCEEARDKVMFGKERPWRAMSENDKKKTACHEAGHALVSMFCHKADPLHKVSIIPRGKMLGGAMYFPEGDKVAHSSDELFERMVIGAGGRCAEKLVFSDLNSGAYGDIRQVSNIARAMVMRFGMSEELGFLEYAKTDEDMGYLGHLSRPEYSEKTAQSIDHEVRRLVDSAVTRATELLVQHRSELDILTDALLERETLSAVDVFELLDMDVPERLKNTSLRPVIEAPDAFEAAVEDDTKDADDDSLDGAPATT
ncbi:hypothetical protein BVX99_00405 [bacterium F16]|nr:hypothetical protein BVX99_00405 [bacterium F16]